MNDHKKVEIAATDIVGFALMLDETTPPLCPAPMPRQTIVFWTPRLMLTAFLRTVAELRWPQRTVRRATVAVTRPNEPR